MKQRGRLLAAVVFWRRRGLYAAMSSAPLAGDSGLARTNYAQPIVAGILAAVVGYASSFTLVLAGFGNMGATTAQAGSGLLSICASVAVLNFVVALKTRIPISFAWSTPGAAFLMAVSAPEGGFAAVTGAFLMTAALVILAGVWRSFARAVAAIPSAIANAMLAGILLTLCLAPLKAVEAMPMLALPVVLSWALALRFARRYAVPIAVLVTGLVLAWTVKLPPGALDGSWPTLVWVMPEFTLDAFLRITLPLFVITMASQNLPGLAVMKSNGYALDPVGPFLLTGFGSVVTAIFGGHTINLAAITAAICAGPEAHADPKHRWPAPVAAGVTYMALALSANLAAAFVIASPPLLIQAVAGLALFSSLAGALATSLASEDERLPAILTFVTAASGITILGIGAAFWGVIAGIALMLVLRQRRTA